MNSYTVFVLGWFVGAASVFAWATASVYLEHRRSKKAFAEARRQNRINTAQGSKLLPLFPPKENN
jgi:hypothetical protein